MRAATDKSSILVEGLAPTELQAYGELCAWTLARAHARAGPRAAIAAYLGDDDTFVRVIARFAVAYADQNEQDHAALVDAAHNGRVKVVVDS